VDRETSLEIHALHARLCKAIADPKRLLIINELRDGPMTVGDLAESLQISQSNTSQHLAILRERGVVQPERSGTSVSYSLRGEKVVQAVDLLREFMAEELGQRSRLGRAATRLSRRR
jgi:ArsR family transcriptional regulator